MKNLYYTHTFELFGIRPGHVTVLRWLKEMKEVYLLFPSFTLTGSIVKPPTFGLVSFYILLQPAWELLIIINKTFSNFPFSFTPFAPHEKEYLLDGQKDGLKIRRFRKADKYLRGAYIPTWQ